MNTIKCLFTVKELDEIKKANKDPEKIAKQLLLFKKGTPYLNVEKPAIVEDGIRLMCHRKNELKAIGETAIKNGIVCKFVPASGAASRMFKPLVSFMDEKTKTTDEILKFTDCFFENLDKFPFYDELIRKHKNISQKPKSNSINQKEEISRINNKQQVNHDSNDNQETFSTSKKRELIALLLEKEGLNYKNLPKALLSFHKYKNSTRTAIEEHLVEAALYTKDKDNQCRISFTVSDEHLEEVNVLVNEVISHYENCYDVHYLIDYSTQASNTDTIAVTPDNKPFRYNNDILFRPAGHGALLENLNNIKSPCIVIKNIDNVVPDSKKYITTDWKKTMIGLAVELQEECNNHIKSLLITDCNKNITDCNKNKQHNHSRDIQSEPAKLNNALTFLKSIAIRLPEGFIEWPKEDKQKLVLKLLDRPLRVCGMVKNQGEPGGGPFWVKDDKGNLSLQIVESSQIAPEGRIPLMNSGTHFNPVDIIVIKQRYDGSLFNLEDYTDPSAVFISTKSIDGNELKALELPGLWNGAMANWNTIFLEVPIETFNPVKTVNDLLRPQHQN